MMSTVDPWIREYDYLCDAYYNPRLARYGGRMTFYNTEGVLIQNDVDKANLCLEHFNQKNKKYFTLEKIVKINTIFSKFYMTIKARDSETGEMHYLRGVADRSSKSSIVGICEIKVDGDVGVEMPHGHEDNGFANFVSIYDKEINSIIASASENRPSRRKKKSPCTRSTFHWLLSVSARERRRRRLK